MKSHKTIKILLLLVFIWKLMVIKNMQITLFSDDAIYASLGKLIIQGKPAKAFHPTWPPLYPILSSIAYLITNNWEISLMLISSILGTLAIIPLYLLCNNFLDNKESILLTTIIIFSEPLLKLSILPLSDTTFTFLALWVTTLTLQYLKKPKTNTILLAGLAAALAYLTRTEGLAFAITTTAFLFLLIIKNRLNAQYILHTAGFLILFILVITPYLIINRINTGYWSVSYKAAAQIKQGHAFQLRNNTTWSQEVVSVKSPNYQSEYFKNALPHILEYSDWYWFWFKQKLQRWIQMFHTYFPKYSPVFIILGIMGLWQKNKISTLYLASLTSSLIPATVFATPLADPRYMLWLIPLIFLTLLLGIKKIVRFPALALIILIIITPSISPKNLLFPNVYAAELSKPLYFPEIIQAARWINQNKKSPRIMMRHEAIEFYTDGETIYTPQDLSIPQLIQYAQKNKVDYIIAWSQEQDGSTISEMLQTNFSHSKLQQEKIFKHENATLIIFSLSP